MRSKRWFNLPALAERGFLEASNFDFNFIRAISCLLIFTGHYGAWHDYPALPRSATVALSMFSFISAYLLSNRPPLYDWNFYQKRVRRIYPTVFVVTMLGVVFLYLLGDFHFTYDILVNLLCLNAIVNHSAVYQELGGGMWYTTFILLAYLVLPLLRWLYEKFNPHIVKCVQMLFVGAIVVNFPWANTNSGYLPFSECFSWFATGIYFFRTKGNNDLINSYPFIVLVFSWSWTGMVVYHFLIKNPALQYLSVAVIPFWAYPLLTMAAKYFEKNAIVRSAVTFISSISFEIYLCHFYIISSHGTQVLNIFNFGPSLYLLSSFTLTVLIAYGIKKIIIIGQNLRIV